MEIFNSLSFRKKIFWLALLVLGAMPMPSHATCDVTHMTLKRGDFRLFHFYFKPVNSAGVARPKALILFISGANGWSGWEDRVADHLQADGYEIFGIDSAIYAQSDYGIDTLEEDYGKLAQAGLRTPGVRPPPLIIGGWSTGAEQSVAIAGGPRPPPGLAGLLLISPGKTGAYGTWATSYMNIGVPRAQLFALADFAPRLDNLRIVQWHAEFDLLDSRTWLSALIAPHREYDFGGAIHDYHSACPEFLTRMSGSLDWILNQPTAPAGQAD